MRSRLQDVYVCESAAVHMPRDKALHFFGYMVFVWCTVCIGVCAYMQENSPCTVCVQNLYLGCKHAPENRVNRLCVC